MGYKEKNFQQEFKEKNELHGVFELKLCKGSSIPFAAVKDHQREALAECASKEGFYHKLSDIPVSAMQKKGADSIRFTRPKPFDCFVLSDQKAYVVIMFYTPRIKKEVYYINIFDFFAMEQEAERKSITERMAEDYSNYTCSFLGSKTKISQGISGGPSHELSA